MNLPAHVKSTFSLTSPSRVAAVWVFALLLLGFTFRNCLEEMVQVWIDVEEYSHGFFIPVISVYFLWLRRCNLRFVEGFMDSLPGLIIVVCGLALFVLGGLATLKTVEQYAFIITLSGIFTMAFGVSGLRIGAVPLLFLIFMVPFPPFILNNLSSKLQIISSWLGVEFIRACDIMVYLEGNVIDLGGYKLQVVEACSGLRYLFPLASLAFLCAYLFNGPKWQKALIFLSSAPLTIFMNSFRIGIIGILVDNWGTVMAEGFLHDFEGWIVFLLCMALLFIEMSLLSRLSGKTLAFSELVLIPHEWSDSQPAGPVVLNKSIGLLLLLLCVTAAGSPYLQGREDLIPERKIFLNFPMQLGNWQGRNDYLSKTYLEDLQLTDYALINYTQTDAVTPVNFYSAYYQSQRKGVSVHSPKGCIPGDGWQIIQFGQHIISATQVEGQALEVNRVVIEKGESRQLVYYWFQQRGRMMTNEFLVKWYLFYDAVTMNRTDGSLIRLVTSVAKNENPDAADQRLQSFLQDLVPVVPAYLPGKNLKPVS